MILCFKMMRKMKMKETMDCNNVQQQRVIPERIAIMIKPSKPK